MLVAFCVCVEMDGITVSARGCVLLSRARMCELRACDLQSFAAEHIISAAALSPQLKLSSVVD